MRIAVIGTGRMGAYHADWLRHQVSFQRRFDPGFAEARRLVAEGALGPLYCIRMSSFDHEPSPEHFIPTSGDVSRPASTISISSGG